MVDFGPGKKMRAGESEYGGKSGRIQKAEDGHDLDAQEKAAVLRGYGIRTPSGETTLDGETWAEGERRRQEAEDRLSGRQVEEGL